jgi:hypothetical protein
MVQLLLTSFFVCDKEWVLFFLDKVKSSHLSNMRVELIRHTEEIARIEFEISEQGAAIKQLQSRSRQGSPGLSVTQDRASRQGSPALQSIWPAIQDRSSRQGSPALKSKWPVIQDMELRQGSPAPQSKWPMSQDRTTRPSTPAVQSNFQSSEPMKKVVENPIAFLHQVLERKLNEITGVGDSQDIMRNSKAMKSAKLRMDNLKESLLRTSLAKAYCEELITDIQIYEARSAITEMKVKAKSAVHKLDDALQNYDSAKVRNELDIKTKAARLEMARKHCIQIKDLLQQNPRDSSAKEELESAERTKIDAMVELELEKRSAHFGKSIKTLSCRTFRLLDLTLALCKLEASVEAGMHDKSRARVFSQLALLRKRQWMEQHSNNYSGQATEAKYIGKIALLNDEYLGMNESASQFADENLLDLCTWSQMVANVVAAEQDMNSIWCKYADEQCSVTPYSPSIRAAEKHLEAVFSETKQEFRSSANEHQTRKFKKEEARENSLVKDELAKLMKATSLSSVVKELALASRTIARDRWRKAGDINDKFPEIDSADYLKLLGTAIKECS